MRIKKSKLLFHITLVYQNGITKTVPVRAVTREIAERQAVKRNPNCIGVKRDA
jgi:hypothetical protein